MMNRQSIGKIIMGWKGTHVVVFSVFADPATEDPYKLEDPAPAPIVVNSGPKQQEMIILLRRSASTYLFQTEY